MNDDRDIERVLGHWLVDGIDAMPDRVFVAILDRVDRQPQALAPRLLRRLPTMTPIIRLTAALAAVVLVAVIGYNLLPSITPGIGGTAPTSPPSPSTSPTPTPIAPVMPEGTLTAGNYRFTPFAPVPLSVSFAVPAGWRGFQNWAILGPGQNETHAPDGIGIGVIRATSIFSDPCRWDALGTGSAGQTGDVGPGPTVDDLVSALRANTHYTTSTPVDVTIDGYRGKQLDLLQPADLDPSTCDVVTADGTGRYFPFGGSEGGLYSQGIGNRWHLTILDVAGTRVIISLGDYAGTPAADQAAGRAIVDSMRFSP